MDKCFVTAQHDDAEVIKVKTKDDEEAKDVKLVPGMDQISKFFMIFLKSKLEKCLFCPFLSPLEQSRGHLSPFVPI